MSKHALLKQLRTTARLLTLALALVAPTSHAENNIFVADFSENQLSHFKEKSFFGHTKYQLVQQGQQTVLRAETSNNASSLYRSMEVDLRQTPNLNWSWRVENVYPITDQLVKQGDDYPARVYVVVRDGWLPWQVRALNYVWSNHPTQLSHWDNPFTDQAIMIPLKAGSAQLGQWHHEQVNIAEDFYRVFGDRIEKIDGVAIMTDADNAGGKATAYYGNIYFSR
jgi:hypothetical protein